MILISSQSTNAFAQTSPTGVDLLYKFDSSASSDGNISNPRGIVAASNGNVYVVDQSAKAVHVFDSSGKFLFDFGSEGTADGEFGQPIDIAIDSSNNLYVTDTHNYRIQVFDSAGNFLYKFGTFGNGDGQFHTSYYLAIDKSNTIYVADLQFNHIQVFDSSGKFLFKFGSEGTGDGQFSKYNSPQGIAVDSSGNIYAADNGNNRIQVFDSSGKFLFKFGSGIAGSGDGEFQGIYGIDVDSHNNAYVSDWNNNRIQVFDSSGKFLFDFGSADSNDDELRPLNVYVDDSDKIYVSEDLSKISGSGKLPSSTANDYHVQVFTLDYSAPEPEPEPVPEPDPIFTAFSTHKNSYIDGETIVISGHVENQVKGLQATLQIFAPNGNRVDLEQFSIENDGNFIVEITAGGAIWKLEGIYMAKIIHGTASAEISFDFTKQNPEPVPQPEPDPESEIWGKIIRLYQQRYPYHDLLHIDSESNNIRDVLCEKTFGENGQKYYENCFSTDLSGKSTKFNAASLDDIPHQRLRVELYTNSYEYLLDTEFFNWNGFPGDESNPIPVPKPVQLISLYTSKSSYNEGDTIVVSGTVTSITVGEQVSITIYLEGNLVDIAQVDVAQDGTFVHTFTTTGSQWQKSGSYIVRALYDKTTVETSFYFYNYNDQEVLGVNDPVPEPEISVTTNKSYYEKDNTIVISGLIKNLNEDYDQPVLIRIFDPVNYIVTIQQVNVNSDGTYSVEVIAGATWKLAGVYTIFVQYGAEKAELIIMFAGGDTTSSGGFDEEACPDCNWTEPDTGTVQPVKEEKTTICHFPPGNVDNPQTLTISENAWKAHDKHGDVFGNCPDKSEDKQFLASAEPVSPKVTPTDTPTQTSQDDDKLSEIIEENKKLREELERQGGEIKELNKQVDYLGEIIASIQRIFSGWFS